jgi:hypothetical protein
MTSKEKAEELVHKFKKYSYYPKTDNDMLFVNELNNNAKQCALIAVDEILDLIDTIYDYDRESLNPYWKEVKKELEKL